MAALQTALEKERLKTTFQGVLAAEDDCPSGEHKVTMLYDVTNGTAISSRSGATTRPQNTKCTITIKFDRKPLHHTFDVSGFVDGDIEPPRNGRCLGAVCFRLGAAFRVTVSATLIKPGKTDVITGPIEVDVIAPHPTRFGYVQFDRRHFVSNSTTISFTNGILSEFSAKNPSEVLGFFELPTAILKTAVIAVPL